MKKRGIIYVATNPSYHALKVGKTDRSSPAPRLKELFTTGVPDPFDCAYAAIVEDNTEVEKYFFKRYEKRRSWFSREFYYVTVPTAIKALKPFEIEDITVFTREEIDALLSDKQKEMRKAERERLKVMRPSAVASKNAHRLIRA